MNDFDKEIKKVMTKEIELSETFKSGVRETIEKIQNSETGKKRNKNNAGYRFVNAIKKIITAILIGASTITVYAATTKNFDFSKLGLMKLEENYNESIVEMDQSVENDYAKITLNSMAGDESYVITEYRIELRDKAISEFGDVDYRDAWGYDFYDLPPSASTKLAHSQRSRRKPLLAQIALYFVQAVARMGKKKGASRQKSTFLFRLPLR